MRSILLSACTLAMLAGPAFGQTVTAGPGKVVTGPPSLPSVEPLVNRPTNLNAATTRSMISPALPTPDLGPNATAADYLMAAQRALSRNQLGLAQSGIENAQTRLLTRSVPQGAVNTPDSSSAISNLSQALQALANHDTATTMNLVQQTLAMTTQGGPGMGMAPARGITPPPPPPPPHY
jgi:hypothetical protein